MSVSYIAWQYTGATFNDMPIPHNIDTDKSRKERMKVETGGNRYFTKLSSFLLFFFCVKKQILLHLVGVGYWLHFYKIRK